MAKKHINIYKYINIYILKNRKKKKGFFNEFIVYVYTFLFFIFFLPKLVRLLIKVIKVTTEHKKGLYRP